MSNNASVRFTRFSSKILRPVARMCLVTVLLCFFNLRHTTAAPAVQLQVVGTLTLILQNHTSINGTAIAIPDADVTLVDSALGTTVSSGRTQLDGKFYLDAHDGGTFQVCWKSEVLGGGCAAKTEVKDQSVYLGVVPIRREGGVVYGTVLTGDGRACWLNDPFFQLDVSTAVVLLDSSHNKVSPTIRANISGQYAFANVKPSDGYIVHAKCEKAVAEEKVTHTGALTLADMTLPNHAPLIVGFGVTENGQSITRASVGSKVMLNVATRDADKDSVEYIWRFIDGNSPFSSGNITSQQWKLPTQPGLFSAYLMARDGKGGYAYKRFSLQVGASDVRFSGRVVDEITQNPIKGTMVEARNGNKVVDTTTNEQGWFNLAIEPAMSPERYILNIKHQNYALLSRIHDKSGTGMTYELIGAQLTTHDPSKSIQIVDTSSKGPCGAPVETLEELKKKLITQHGDTRENPAVEPSKPCAHRGAQVIVPARALVDRSKKIAKGPIRMAFATLDPGRRALPGDYRAITRQGGEAELLSFGAAHVEFRDAGGGLLQLKPRSRAEVRIPVSNNQLAAAKPTIALWSYNEKIGTWAEEGKAALKNTPDGWMYIGKTRHFSTINMDVAGNDPAQATCVRFQLGASLTAWSNLNIRSYVSYAGSFSVVKETPWDGAQYNAIYRIPYAPPAAPPNTLRLEVRGTYMGQQVVLLNRIIHTDAPRPKMTGNDLWPTANNYEACGDAIVLEADPTTLPYYGVNDATGRPFFLTGPYGTYLPPNGEQVATDYYTAIDSTSNKTTLGAWWGLNGFNNINGSGGTRAAYLNHNDLGFGRDMNCLKTGNDLACYVTNFGDPDQNPQNAIDAESRNPGTRGATVTMEYKSSEPAANRVRFFVFGGGVAGSPRIKFADLDGLGPKPVPHLCTVCHAGGFVANNVAGARFREFDLPSFKYSGGRSWDYAPAPNTLTAAELTSFATLNRLVRDIAPTGAPIQLLIDNWYTGGFGPGASPVKPAVPTGWTSQVNGYHDVYGKTCRTCHVARDASGPTFDTFTPFSSTSYVVCGAIKKMPNAYITYKNFWSDLQRVIAYRALTGESIATCH